MLTSALLSLMLFSAHARADSAAPASQMIEVEAPQPEQHATLLFSPTVVKAIAGARGTDVEQVSEDEAVARAARDGIRLKRYGHPWFIVKAGIGLPAPGMVNAEVEIFVDRNWTVEAGAGTGLTGNVFTGTVHWRPDATCFGCSGKNMLSVGFGLQAGYGYGEGAPTGFVAAVTDAMYIHRFAEHFGWTVGTQIGAGPGISWYRNETLSGGTPASSSGSGTPPTVTYGPLQTHWQPVLTFMLYTGFVF